MGEQLLALQAFLEQHADETADAALLAGISMIERACQHARESMDFRWRSYPRGEIKKLRRSLRTGLLLVRFALHTREVDDERWYEATKESRMEADLLNKARRRAQTMPAELARLENAKRRREGNA